MFKIKTYYISMSEKHILNLLNKFKKEDINIGKNNRYFSRDCLYGIARLLGGLPNGSRGHLSVVWSVKVFP